MALAWTGDELSRRQAKNGVNFYLKLHLTLKFKVNHPQNRRYLNQGLLHLWPKFGDPSWNGSWVISRGQARDWRTDGYTHTHTHRRRQRQYPKANTGLGWKWYQNSPRIDMKCFPVDIQYYVFTCPPTMSFLGVCNVFIRDHVLRWIYYLCLLHTNVTANELLHCHGNK